MTPPCYPPHLRAGSDTARKCIRGRRCSLRRSTSWCRRHGWGIAGQDWWCSPDRFMCFGTGLPSAAGGETVARPGAARRWGPQRGGAGLAAVALAGTAISESVGWWWADPGSRITDRRVRDPRRPGAVWPNQPSVGLRRSMNSQILPGLGLKPPSSGEASDTVGLAG